MNPTKEFEEDLVHLINRYSLENGSNTPDFILAQYLCACLCNFNSTVQARTKWFYPEPKSSGIDIHPSDLDLEV